MSRLRFALPAGLVAMLLMLGIGLYREQALGQEKGKPGQAGTKWEYKVMDFTVFAKADNMEVALNKLGDDGWDWAGIVGGTGKGGGPPFSQPTRVILKRPKQ